MSATIAFTPQLGELLLEKLPNSPGMTCLDLAPHFPQANDEHIRRCLATLYKARLVGREMVRRGANPTWLYWRV